MTEAFVNMGEIYVLKATGILTTVGLGSCVGVALYDPVARVGGMAHIFLARSREREKDSPKFLPGKYADTGIPALLEQVLEKGARKERLVAKIAGGAHLFPNLATSRLSVGEQNVTAVRQELSRNNIPITGEDVSGNHGRKMRFFVDSGVVVVTGIGRQPVEI